jgi:DNA-binding GntR family transcriptional regulator
MSLTTFGGPERSKTAHQFALDYLRRAILDGSLAGGTRLLQAQGARELGLSTTPVREALRDLAAEGLILFDANRGALVRRLEMAEVREIYQMRRALEPLLVERAIGSISPELLDRAEELIEQMDADLEPHDFVALNRDFHEIFHGAFRGCRLCDVITGLQDASMLYVNLSLERQPTRMRQANAEHRLILAAFREGDRAEATRVSIDHLTSTLRLIEETQHVGPAVDPTSELST